MKRPLLDRFWFYDRHSWTPRWWNQIGVPQFRGTGDEDGYQCVVWGTRFTGYVVCAYWRCPCWDCVGFRIVHEARGIHGDAVADEVDGYLHRIRLLNLSQR